MLKVCSTLKGAYDDLEHAGGEWGGHRVKAMAHIQRLGQRESLRQARELRFSLGPRGVASSKMPPAIL